MELKKRMTFEEMADHFEDVTGKFPTKSSVGKFARQMGFEIHKPYINGVLHFFYVNPNIGKEKAGSEKE